MKTLLCFCLLCSFSTIEVFGAEPFEGTVEYKVSNEGTAWKYQIWTKGSHWRSELSLAGQVYELRIGDSETGEAFMVSEKTKTYRRIGGMRGLEGMGPGGPPPGKKKPEKEKPLEFDKVVNAKKQTETILERSARLYQLKGPGKKLDLWVTDELSGFPETAIPRFKITEPKHQVFELFWEEQGGFPLKLSESGKSSDKAFSMVAVSIERIPVLDRLVTIPENFEEKLPTGPGGFGGGMGRPRPDGGGGRPRMPR